MTKVKAILPFKGLKPNTYYLLLISPQKIPHLAIVYNDAYFSLTHKKSILGEYFDPYLAFFKRTNRSILFIELNQVDGNPVDIFKRFDKADTKKNTCLNPVKEVILKSSDANFIYELIPELYESNRIQQVYQLNLADHLDDLGDFNLKEYSKNAIFEYIEQLNEKHAKR